MIAMSRIMERYDRYLSQKDIERAERHLACWLEEAERENASGARLALLNEQIGLFRSLRRENDALEAIRQALTLTKELALTDFPALASTLINAATGLAAFGRADEALPLFERAREIYAALYAEDDLRQAALCNNMALTLRTLGRFDEAETLLYRAITLMGLAEHGEGEMAVSYCSLAEMLFEAEGEAARERIENSLREAKMLLEADDLPQTGRYAYVCEKCASAFGAFGMDEIENELLRRAAEIYRREREDA